MFTLSTADTKDKYDAFKSYDDAKILKNHYETLVSKASNELAQFPKNEMGIIPDDIRETKEYKGTKAYYDHVFSLLQKYNQWFVKYYKKEYMEDRKNKKKG